MRLYKYYPLSSYSKRIFTDHELYFSPFKTLNDPFEIAVKYTFECDHETKHQHFLKSVPIYSSFSPDGQKKYIKDFEDAYSKGNHLLLFQLREFFQHAGLTCFSETPDNILMWGHYASKHRGFCVEFETTLDPIFNDLVQVEYRKDFKETLFYNGLNVKDAVNAKFDVWSYEREWRLVQPKVGAVKINPKCITKVFSGHLNRFIPTEKNEFGDKDVYFNVVNVASSHLPNAKCKSFMVSKEKYLLSEY